jgi:hypothetical protein
MSESQSERYETRSSEEIAPLFALADSFLPQETQPRIGPDNTLCTTRSYDFKDEILDDEILGGSVQRIVYENEADCLVVYSIRWLEDSKLIVTKNYILVLNNGRFFVLREARDENTMNKKEPPEVNVHDLNTQHELEFDLGLFMPEPGDWEEFISLLNSAKAHYEKHIRTQEHLNRAGRLSRLFSKFLRK